MMWLVIAMVVYGVFTLSAAGVAYAFLRAHRRHGPAST
jgi:hypothetical protein